LADIGHRVNGNFRELFRLEDWTVDLHIGVCAHARVVDDSASLPQKFFSAAGQAASRRVGMSETVLKKPPGAALFMSHNVIQSAKAGNLHIFADKSNRDTVWPRNDDGM